MTRYHQFALQQSCEHEDYEQVIYDHWLDCVRNESPSKLLNRFHDLFILGQRYSDAIIRMSLEKVLLNAVTPADFLPFFNRCCYILVNHWQMNPAEKGAIVELVELINQVRSPSVTRCYDRATKRLRSMVYHYTQSKYYSQLRRIAEFVRDKGQISQQEPLVALIDRYPYLYSHCLKANHQDPLQSRILRQSQAHAQKKFETDLSRYVALTALRKGRSPVTNEDPLKNPTLLTTEDLHVTLKHFVGRSTRKGTYREMSSSFTRTVDRQLRFQDFKSNLFDYLTADIDPQYGNKRFNYNLRKHINSISPEYHRQPTTDILKTRTYNQILNHLVIESRKAPKHAVFMDLITNLGTTRTVGLLLKLVLLSGPVKSSLERRLGVLFQHYESHRQVGIQWLVRCLEKVNLAFTTHFGQMNVSYITVL